MTAIINSQVFATGTKFVVTDKTTDSSFGPGTTGYISYVKGRDQDYKNVVYYKIATLRRGKTGKERLDINEISTPVFEINHANVTKTLPDEKRRYFVHIEPAPNCANIHEMSNMEFLAYSLAYSKWVRKLNTRAKHVNAWPNGSEDVLNTYVRLEEFYNEDPGMVKNVYAEEEKRTNFITRIRIMESTLVRCSLSYMLRVAQIEENAAKYILDCGHDLGVKGAMKATLSSYSNKTASLAILAKAHGKDKSHHLLKAAADGVSWS